MVKWIESYPIFSGTGIEEAALSVAGTLSICDQELCNEASSIGWENSVLGKNWRTIFTRGDFGRR